MATFRSNCIIWALGQWRREGGYVALRRSNYGWWPHMLWSPDMVVWTEFVPVAPKRKRRLPPLWFRGRVIVGAR